MSHEHLDLVFKQSRTCGPARAILMVLASHANKEGVSWPGLERLAREAGVTRRTVIRHLPCIEAAGELRIERRSKTVPTRRGPQATNLYRIILCPREDLERRPAPLNGKAGTDSPEGRDSQSHKVETDSPEGRDGLTPESSENRHIEPSENRQGRHAGSTGQRTDYERALLPSIEDYSDIHKCPDPILAAMAVTEERSKQGWGHWVKVLNRARKELGSNKAERLFRDCVGETWGEKKNRECRRPGAILNMKLQKVFG